VGTIVLVQCLYDGNSRLLLPDCQHGFVRGSSIVSDLLEYSSFVWKSI
jgi:hypothetical protein